FGYTVEELEARGGALQAIHPGDLPRAAAMIRGITNGEQPRAELRVVTKSGDIRWMRFHYTTEAGRDADGRIQLFGVGRDVTEEIEARRALAASTARVR